MQYKKYGLVLLLSNLLVVTAWLCVRGVEINTIASRQAFRASVMEDIADFQETSVSTVVQAASSDQRVIHCGVLEKKPILARRQPAVWLNWRITPSAFLRVF